MEQGGESDLWLIAAFAGAELEQAAAAAEGGAKGMAGPSGTGPSGTDPPGTGRLGLGGGPGLLSCGGAADLCAGQLCEDLDLVFEEEAELEEAAGGSGLWLIALVLYNSFKRSPNSVFLKPPTCSSLTASPSLTRIPYGTHHFPLGPIKISFSLELASLQA